ncbi:NAD(P)/FAD-dependent oxidoreductase [Emticicia sp. 21SJ11W-3]|uniref:phytoene desaturase family protein n=1 Tax=Emticicia sp. 21SJ11W-3 TaxID=2916755 RepID=UPI00209E9CC4|nr:phytoene desaturase family protein [Emticicia sp. 21SJ11W-3]UTA68337.1 phytoene desaturase family protein [Emticicia sp. 21SJ11W-3]
MKKAVVIGAGFAGLSAATKLADEGYEVVILEKNSMAGGRARIFEEKGFMFDMGPSWYWMPDVFEQYFATYGKKVSDYYNLVRLNPSYKVIFGPEDDIDLPANLNELKTLFDTIEPGSSKKLEAFLEESKYKYEVGVGEFVWKPSLSITEFFDFRLLTKALSLDLFASFGKHIRKFFSSKKLLQLMEFPILFLGATPQNTPALYSLMNYAEIALGTWYPMGGMHEIVKAMVQLAEEKGVDIRLNEEVTQIVVQNGMAQKVITKTGRYDADVVIGGADYHHIETNLLDKPYRNYSDSYWQSRTMAPSSLLFYLGVDRKIDKLIHHNLFFDEDFNQHAKEIYTSPQWPSKPLFYVSAPSKTDTSVAPEGSENLFILIPIAPDLEDNEAVREKYYDMVMARLENYVGHNIKEHVIYKRSFAVSDFKSEYHSFRGNAYGLANTLLQTAFLKPSLKNKKVRNLYYTGQLTVPGPGVPPSLISGQVVANEVLKEFGKAQKEVSIA